MKFFIIKFLILIGVVFVVIKSQAQSVDWINGYSVSKSNSAATDVAGNIYTTGEFQNTSVFGTNTLTAQGFWPDVYITKTNASGNLIWASRFGGKDLETVRSISTIGSDIYIAGQFKDTIIVGTSTMIASGTYNNYIAKFDQSGNCIWAKRSDVSEIISICGDGVGSNILACGRFSGTASFGTQTLTASGISDIFIALLDPNGNTNNFIQLGGSANDAGYCIKTDNTGNVYIGGFFMGTAFFGALTLTSLGSTEAFIAKLTPGLSVVWAKRFGGPGTDGVSSISINSANNIYFSASYGSTPLTIGVNTFTSGNSYVCQLDNTGSVLFSNNFGGTSSGNFATINSLAADASGNVYSFGDYKGMASFGSTTLSPAFLNSSTQDMFLSKLDASGNFVWVKGFGSTSFTDYGNSMCLNNNNLYVTGTAGPMIVDNYTLTSSSGFLAKINITPVGVEENYNSINVKFYPNPIKDKLVIESEEFNQNLKISITDVLGKTILTQEFFNSKTQTLNVSQLLPGIYFIRINSEKKNSLVKVLKE